MNLSSRVVDTPALSTSGTCVVTLFDLPVGGRGTVESVDRVSDSCGARRLYDLGFRPGEPVGVTRRCLPGGPRVYTVADYELALRAAQARTIRVRVAA